MQPPSHPLRTRILGIDGCRAGWLVAERHPNTAALTFQILNNDDLRFALHDCAMAFVDMPIGLPETECARPADRALRAVLSRGRRSSVFNPPVRQVLACDAYADANAASRLACGAGLSKQSWFLVPRIRALDQILSGRQDLQAQVLESHPEWLFERLAVAELASKKTAEGFQQRLAWLAKWAPEVVQSVPTLLASVRRSAVLPDDVLDALVLLREAQFAQKNGVFAIPDGSQAGPGCYHAALPSQAVDRAAH
jgi:predicted RNase H-like nuclease